MKEDPIVATHQRRGNCNMRSAAPGNGDVYDPRGGRGVEWEQTSGRELVSGKMKMKRRDSSGYCGMSVSLIIPRFLRERLVTKRYILCDRSIVA